MCVRACVRACVCVWGGGACVCVRISDKNNDKDDHGDNGNTGHLLRYDRCMSAQFLPDLRINCVNHWFLKASTHHPGELATESRPELITNSFSRFVDQSPSNTHSDSLRNGSAWTAARAPAPLACASDGPTRWSNPALLSLTCHKTE